MPRVAVPSFAVGWLLVLAGVSPVAAEGPSSRDDLRSPPGVDSMVEQDFVPGEVIVAFEPGVDAARRSTALAGIAPVSRRPLDVPGAVLARLPRGTSVEEAVSRLERRPEVRYAEPNVLHEVAATPNDPRFGDLWGLHQASDADIDAPEAWNVTKGSRRVVVAVVDTGVAYRHPDLARNIWANNDPPGGGDDDGNGKRNDTHGWDFVQNDNQPFDYHGHGTAVAGTIGAEGNNARGITGVNWRVSIMPLRAGDGKGFFPATAVAAAFRYACAEGADVINGSFASEQMSSLVRDAVLSCPGALFVFAAGNHEKEGLDLDGSGNNAYPCELHRPPTSAKNLLCVGATDDADGPAPFSNHGTQAVHLAAPGAGILSAVPAYRTVWEDGFDDPTDDGFNGRWGDRSPPGARWDRTNALKRSGSHSLTDSPGTPYEHGTKASIQTRHPVDLSGDHGCRIDHQIWYETEPLWDRFDIVVGRTKQPTNLDDRSWSGSSGGSFLPFSNDLSRFDGGPVYIRFRFESDESNTDGVERDGVYVDDVRVKCLRPAGERYLAGNGTSLAAAHVSGVAALVLAWDPVRTVGNLKTALTSSVDRRPSLADKAITGGRLNAAKALQAPKTKIVKLKASRKVVRKGRKVRLIATVRPCAGHQGEFVRFQRKVKGGWKAIGKRTTNLRCKAKLPRRMKRTTVFRVISPRQDADHLTGISNTVKVRVRRR